MAVYESKWKDKINELAAQIQNRGPFQFDFNADAMAQNIRDQAILNGQRAMKDTLARASAMTGGQLSSYSQAAGHQIYNRYLQDLSGQLMGIADLAMKRYDQEGDRLQDQLRYLEGQDDKDYDRWMDAEKMAYQKERDAIEDAFREAAMAGAGGGGGGGRGSGRGSGRGGGDYGDIGLGGLEEMDFGEDNPFGLPSASGKIHDMWENGLYHDAGWSSPKPLPAPNKPTYGHSHDYASAGGLSSSLSNAQSVLDRIKNKKRKDKSVSAMDMYYYG